MAKDANGWENSLVIEGIHRLVGTKIRACQLHDVVMVAIGKPPGITGLAIYLTPDDAARLGEHLLTLASTIGGSRG